MEYQKLINFLDNKPNQPTKFRTKNWFETRGIMMNHVERTTLIVKLQNLKVRAKRKISILRSSLCDYSDGYMLVSATITVQNIAAAYPNNRKIIIVKNFHPFTNCISEIKNIQINNGKDIDIVMSMYNLIE